VTIAAGLTVLATFAPAPNPMPTVVEQLCPAPGVAACASVEQNVVYVEPLLVYLGGFSFMETLGHELGHVWAAQHPAALSRFTAMVHASSSASVAIGERFADVYALCAIGPKRRALLKRVSGGAYYGTYGERITHRVLSSTCWLLRHP
jgi:hypothetical protein